MFLEHLPSVAVMALDRGVLKELYADTRSDVSDGSESELLDSDSDVPTASSHKQFQLPTVVRTSDSDKNTQEEENSESESSDVWCETDKKPFLGTSGVNKVIDHPVSVADVNTIIGDDLIQLLTGQSKIGKINTNGKCYLKH
jgi:hypothetical protein